MYIKRLFFTKILFILHTIVFCNKEGLDEILAGKVPEVLLKEPGNTVKQPDDLFKQPEDMLKQPEDMLKQPEDMLKPPEDMPNKPEDISKQPEDMSKQPEDMLKQPEDMLKPPEDMMKQPEDMLRQPEDMSKQPEDMLKQPEDMLKQPEDMLKQPEDMLKLPEEMLKMPENTEKQPGVDDENVFSGKSAFDAIYKHNEEVGLAHNHPPGFHLFEGDILAPDIDLDEPVDAQKRGAVKSELRLWRERTIPFVVDSKRIGALQQILLGMKEISDRSCIKFVPRTTEKNYLKFIKGNGCWSFIGVRGGSQDISIGRGCEYKAIVAHEILHALGFYHEQSRLDRDDYVKIYWKNIEKDNRYNFMKAPPNAYTDSNLPYDLKSVMHYGNYAFSKNGKVTISSKKFPQVHLGNDVSLSPGDVDELASLYRCKELPLGGFGPWYDESSCIDGLRIRFRVCYGKIDSVCAGFGVQNGIQRVREVCEGSEPLAAYMEGCYNQIHPEIVDLPLQAKATGVACASLNSPSKDYFEWRRKQKITYIICAHFARNDGYMIFGISNYCHCHYGDDLVDMTANGESKWCTKGYGVKDSIYMYRFESDMRGKTTERKRNMIKNNNNKKKKTHFKELRHKHHY